MKFKRQPSAGKMMATVFWDAKGVLECAIQTVPLFIVILVRYITIKIGKNRCEIID